MGTVGGQTVEMVAQSTLRRTGRRRLGRRSAYEVGPNVIVAGKVIQAVTVSAKIPPKKDPKIRAAR